MPDEHGVTRDETIAALRARIAELEAARAADTLAASERRYRDLVETSQDLIWSTDAEGRWTFLNRAATLRIYGREAADLLGHHFTELETPEQARRDMPVFERILAGEKYFEYETVHLHRDGTPVHLSFNAIVLHDEQGRVIGTTGTAKDITERRRAEAERQEMQARLLQTQKLESLGVLAGGIAHDFNNLLVGIVGNAGLALMALPPGVPGRRAVEGVRDAAQRAADLARQMLAYSGRGKFVVERIDLSRLVQELGHLLSAVISKRASLHLRTPPGLPAVEGDATQLRQVVMNLITNASDAVEEHGGTITVTTGVMHVDAAWLAGAAIPSDVPPGAYVFVSVEDTGCGMDAVTRERLFEPFYTTKFTGRGLGLAAVLGILRSHRGTIRVDSEIGLGARLCVLLPPAAGAALAGAGDLTVGEHAVAAPAIARHDAGHDAGHGAGSGAGQGAGQGAGHAVAGGAPAAAGHAAGAGSRPAPAQAPAETDRPCILVVDDEELVRDVTRAVLEHAGFRVLTAADGHAALASYAEHRGEIAAVLLDLTMPRLSGEGTFRELQRIDPAVRIILTSGYSEQDATQGFAGRGLAGFVRKPCSPLDMIASVRSALQR
jgi:two-component system, cell cycle sensor histidine kinase and response regulator CckA